MTRTRAFVIGVLFLVGAGITAGVFVWRSRGPSGRARRLLGAWEIIGAGFEDAVKKALEKNNRAAARAAGDSFSSTERIYFDRDGSCRHVQDFLGMTITADGTWQASETNEHTLAVKFHKK